MDVPDKIFEENGLVKFREYVIKNTDKLIYNNDITDSYIKSVIKISKYYLSSLNCIFIIYISV